MSAFNVKMILGFYKKQDGARRVYLQAIIERRPVRIPLDFYLKESHFDKKGTGRVKASHPNADDYNAEFLQAIAKANTIASQFRQKSKALSESLFTKEFTNPSDEMNLIKYLKRELELKGPDLSPNTIKQHNTVLNKLEAFNKVLRFGDINPEMMQRFKNSLKKEELKPSTINKILKIVKQYLIEARKKGHEFEDPFKIIKLKTFKSNRIGLSENELKKLEEYYESNECTPSHKKLLRYFIFSCYTGLRISDVGRITWNNIYDDLLSYIPEKTKSKGEPVIVPITKEKKYLPEFKPGNVLVFDKFSDQVTNRYLKKIAAHLGIKKTITFHTSRHTFGTLMAEGGHIVETQRMMGHGDIKTTMGYVHASNKSVINAKNLRFSENNEPNNLTAKDKAQNLNQKTVDE